MKDESSLVADAIEFAKRSGSNCSNLVTFCALQETKMLDIYMQRPLLPCRCCNASGKVQMPDEMWTLLLTIRKSKEPISTKDLPRDGIGCTGLNNRLTTLETLGLIERRGKKSKFILWAATPQPNPILAEPPSSQNQPDQTQTHEETNQ